MIIAFGAALYWKFRSGSKLLLLAPPPMAVLKILGFGVILPCVVYFALSQIKLLSGYDCEMPASVVRLLGQMALLLALLPAAVLTLTDRVVVARCHELGVATPPHGRTARIRRIVAVSGLILLLIIAFIPLPMLLSAEMLLNIVKAVLVVIILLQTIHWITILFRNKDYSIYYGAYARMLLLTFGLAVLVLTCVFRPILDWREAAFIKEDKIMFGAAESCTKIEGEVVKELKDAINQAMDKIRK
jgi:hypothetical protein